MEKILICSLQKIEAHGLSVQEVITWLPPWLATAHNITPFDFLKVVNIKREK